MKKALLLVICSSTYASAAFAQPPQPVNQPADCKALTEQKKKLAATVLANVHPYRCCDEPLSTCLKAKRVCRLAWRLAANICRRVKKGEAAAKIKRAMSRRSRSMLALGKKAAIALDGVPIFGDKGAPTSLVIYACARCPFCSKLIPELHDAIKSGPLKGKVRLAFKTFPIRNHKHSKLAGLGFIAAARLGKFWPFMREAYAHFSSFSDANQRAWAKKLGFDCARFSKALAEPATRRMLIAQKKEGLRNKVKATPTLFIDGRRYVGELNAGELIDVLQEAWDHRQKRVYR
jgi:protein-disulfide isomerase